MSRRKAAVGRPARQRFEREVAGIVGTSFGLIEDDRLSARLADEGACRSNQATHSWRTALTMHASSRGACMSQECRRGEASRWALWTRRGNYSVLAVRRRFALGRHRRCDVSSQGRWRFLVYPPLFLS
jgi:hypothetical protein